MIRLDGYYLYELGHKLHGIAEIDCIPIGENKLHNCAECLGFLYPAVFALEELMLNSVYRFRSLGGVANRFRLKLDETIKHCSIEPAGERFPTTDLIFGLQEVHREFEAVLRAELSSANIFLAIPKSAFDVGTLVESGELAFSNDLLEKVPDSREDVRSAMRCIAFELPTAAAFHFYRALETVLGAYWDSVTGKKPRPRTKTLGSYLQSLEKEENVSKHVLSSLRDIKDLHRNPTIHPEQFLSNIEEAIDLHGAIRAAFGVMLREIPIFIGEAIDPDCGSEAV